MGNKIHYPLMKKITEVRLGGPNHQPDVSGFSGLAAIAALKFVRSSLVVSSTVRRPNNLVIAIDCVTCSH